MKNKIRDPFFDNAKFLLLVIVVFGHLLQPFIGEAGWVHDLYFTIYTFHMPAFILISGYFAKSFARKFQVEVSHLLKFVCYLIFILSSLGLTMSWGMVSAISRIGRTFLDSIQEASKNHHA